ncbi:glycoside hydrolase family 130 protein [Lunatibacter salilacus]|uniref:glycoside hydrolase family 130 protein n=1 Tax=Lunatibacter salilacus TaxID=2483804 RepID=UPI00131B84F3|nr:glycoside hydrolase family 130 protein [Lunatibacter salilacus]
MPKFTEIDTPGFLSGLIGLFVIAWLAISCQSSHTSNNETTEPLDSWSLGPFVKVDSINPVLEPGDLTFLCPILNEEVAWEAKDVFNPAAVVKDGKINLLYRAEDFIGTNNGTSRIGLAISEDGLQFTKRPSPIFYPENDSLKPLEWDGGVEDPRVISTDDGRYFMTYTSYDGTTARLMYAISDDLISWDKYGRVLTGEFKDSWSKAGAVVGEQQGDQVIAKKINGKYWMYFGDTDLYMAVSQDLINWRPVLENGRLKSVLAPRPGKFDSRLVEAGPFGLIRDEGILLLYNGMNLDEGGDPDLVSGAYSAGQALFSLDDPTQVIDRSENYFLTPEKDYEIDGQINHVCFIEGMVPYKGNWFLYYGTADSKIAVAICKL